MAYTLSGSATSGSRFLYASGVDLNTTFAGSPGITWAKTFSSTDVTKIYFDSLTVTTSPTTIDVTALTDVFNQAVNFATIKHIQIVNNATTAGSLTAGGGTDPLFSVLPNLVAQNPTSGSVGSCINLTTNLTVSGSVKNIRLVATAGSLAVDIFLVGS